MTGWKGKTNAYIENRNFKNIMMQIICKDVYYNFERQKKKEADQYINRIKLMVEIDLKF